MCNNGLGNRSLPPPSFSIVTPYLLILSIKATLSHHGRCEGTGIGMLPLVGTNIHTYEGVIKVSRGIKVRVKAGSHSSSPRGKE